MFFLFFFFFFSFFLFFFLSGIYFMNSYSYFFELFVVYGEHIDFSFVFLFDYVSLFFFSFVSLISSIVFLYSKFYMSDFIHILNVDNSRFFYLLFLFVVSMFFLVFSGSWIVVLFGWDGLGLVSFLLVIYFNNASSLDSGLLTFFTNRVGDGFFILSFMFMFFSGWLDYSFLGIFSSFFIILFLVMGCFTKSAQIPFSSWLPAAMSAPTPVSSLVHSSTLVTAGVYLFIRFNYFLSSAFFIISTISLFTMFLAGVCAVYEKDMKKVVAMSTLSQLGFMFFSISIGCWLISFLHMMFHAFFKSSLFLSTGNIMSNLFGEQDSRLFGSLGFSFFSKLFFVTSCISLMGFPFSLGFYSKDIIIGSFFTVSSSFYFFLFVLSCILTVVYSFRLIFGMFLFFPSFGASFCFMENLYFFFPVVILYLLCVFFGNFFFFFFTLPLTMSFFDCFLGVFIILTGFLLYLYLPSFFFIYCLSNSICFLSFFPTPLLSSLYLKFSFLADYTWFEVIGGQGFLKALTFLYYEGKLVFMIGLSVSIFFFFLILFF